jgi:hypothetical protein
MSNSILTETFRKIDCIGDISRILQWVRAQTLTPEMWKDKPIKRLDKWYCIQAPLLDYGRAWRTYEAPGKIEFHLFLGELRDKYYPEANNVLLYKYVPGVGISDHQDKPVFNRKVILINLIDALIRHGLPPVKHDRYSIQFRVLEM